MMMGLVSLIGLGTLVCWIMVLIKQFQLGSVVHGIIGIVTCGLWTLIWGWINAAKHNIRNLMLIWTILIVVALLLQGVGMGSMLAGLR